MSGEPEGNTAARDKSRARCGHCGVIDPRHAWKLHAREPRDPVAIHSQEGVDRWEKAMSYKTHVNGDRESHSGVVCAEQRVAQEGSSPSGARMRSAISKSGGNASLAEENVCFGGQGVHREVESEGHEEKYRAVIDGGHPEDEPVGQRWGKVEPAL